MPGFELIDEKEKEAVLEVFDKQNGVFFAHGFDALRNGRYQVREFEKACADKFGVNHALAVSSGTSALLVALKAAGIKEGDEVITQAFTFVATVEAILLAGAKPVVVNVDDTLNMDVQELEDSITKKTKAIIPVHMLGMPADMNKILEIANKYNLKVIEDNCESIGAKLNNKYLGTFGDIGVISFDHGKALTTGEGGMLLTSSKELDDLAREYHDHGHENNPTLPRGKDTKRIAGFNFRMTELQAAIGKVQLSKLNFLLDENFKRYNVLDKHLSEKIIIRKVVDKAQGQYDCYIFKVKQDLFREKIIELLKEKGFGTKNIPDAVEWHCAFYWDHLIRDKERRNLERTKKLLEQYIAIPINLRKTVGDYDSLGLVLAELCD